MNMSYFVENRRVFYDSLENGTIALVFSGHAFRKTADELWPFYCNRNFLFLTGMEKEKMILMAVKEKDTVTETVFCLPTDAHEERWHGKRLRPDEITEISGIDNVQSLDTFEETLHSVMNTGRFEKAALDLYRNEPTDEDTEPFIWARRIQNLRPSMQIVDFNRQLRIQRTIKKPCEIEAVREAAKITRAGIVAMMKASHPGVTEIELKTTFDLALAKCGCHSPAFPSIVSVGSNNFCIHYYDYTGTAKDGDMVLNDVGAQYDHLFNDVSRGYPVNGKFTEKQRLLYTCALNTSDYMFSIIKPGIPMGEVDMIARRYCYEQLKSIGLCESYDDITTYMWHKGAHHVGYDVHDCVEIQMDEPIRPGMIFCVDIGIYCEKWGIGFRVEDNCLVTEDGCENLTACVPRTIEDIEAVMAGEME